MYMRDNVIRLALMFLISLSAFAQNRPIACPSSDLRCSDNGCIPKPTFLQQCRHIELMPATLFAALQNQDPVIRDAAAETLAHNTDMTGLTKDTVVSALITALKNEKQVRFEIASDLVDLGAQEGFSALRDMCNDQNLIAFRRISAAQALANAGDEHCLDNVLTIMQSASDQDRTYALSTLPSYKQISPEQSQAIFSLLTKSLTDKTSLVRSSASRALVELGKTEAIPYLESALASERDEHMKLQLETDLRRLREQR